VSKLGCWVLLGMPLLLSCGGIADPAEEKAEAERLVARWVLQHAQEWSVNLTSPRTLVRPYWSQPCSRDPDSGFTALALNGEGGIMLFFRCPLGGERTPEALQHAFAFMVIDDLPHGIVAPGWTFTVYTPASSFEDGVTFSAPQPNVLAVNVETPLYGVYGRSTRSRCEPRADEPMRSECYVFREHRIPLRLRLTVPFSGSELQ
jgi:hypothetical protein